MNNIEVVGSYLNAIREKDLSRIPLAADVSFEDPLTPKLSGRQAAIAFISGFLPAIKDVKIRQHIAQGEFVATMWDADTTFGVIPIFEYFRVIDGAIREIKAYLDPRPLTNPNQ
ncbi:MAG TPA: nuclear transport factor 2 family protein [Blastocatellia bacterium]|nr:nuclear transport factor 2 family protein [Blastocatellia bacterium]